MALQIFSGRFRTQISVRILNVLRTYDIPFSVFHVTIYRNSRKWVGFPWPYDAFHADGFAMYVALKAFCHTFHTYEWKTYL